MPDLDTGERRCHQRLEQQLLYWTSYWVYPDRYFAHRARMEARRRGHDCSSDHQAQLDSTRLDSPAAQGQSPSESGIRTLPTVLTTAPSGDFSEPTHLPKQPYSVVPVAHARTIASADESHQDGKKVPRAQGETIWIEPQ
ncbi:hypothetical protein N7516_006098 [Penicillium verrucosum]|uniref:uncharacterized protein n=1 Tax=Penicillium verrucosum TaxID=60171 RepID=UPI002544FFB2|nr:uncharacterized protein N7516_006098 [Penicillium verrucosum]KAJ5931609.1 hypothetical protein N7516_006098 [Penicillium verrucosum]